MDHLQELCCMMCGRMTSFSVLKPREKDQTQVVMVVLTCMF